MRAWDDLSFDDFERVVGDLLSAVDGVHYERFGPGADAGVDLRRMEAAGRHVVQVKHYRSSTFSQLKSACGKEKKKLEALPEKPVSYRLVTSMSLTVGKKDKLVAALAPFVWSPACILGIEEVDDLLDRHPEVERRHPKLWVGSAGTLQTLLSAATYSRSRRLAEDIERKRPLWVSSDAFSHALDTLLSNRICVIAGPPGIGKTTLAHMLVGAAIRDNYEPVEISADVEEAWATYNTKTPQVFLYDDFLGTALLELGKNEDRRLVSFFARIAADSNKLLVLTTREHIVRRATEASWALRDAGVVRERVVLNLEVYTPIDRGRILHNHVWASELTDDVFRELAADRGYRRIVDHPNFTPRLIEFITGTHGHLALRWEDGESWLDAAVRALDSPEEIWRHAYVNQLGDVERSVLHVLATLPAEVHLEDLKLACDAHDEVLQHTPEPSRFERALAVLDNSFVENRLRLEQPMVRMANPGILDFVQRLIAADLRTAQMLIEGTVFFEQLTTFWRLAADVPGLRAAIFTDDLVALLDRLSDAPTCVWITVATQPGQDRLERWRVNAEARLANTYELAATPGAPQALITWCHNRFGELRERWQRGHGDPHGGLALARQLLSIVDSPVGWERDIAGLLRNAPVQTADWRLCLELRDEVPGAYDEDEWEQLRGEFSGWADEALTTCDDHPFWEEEFEGIQEIADELEIDLPAELLEAGEREVARREEFRADVEPDRLGLLVRAHTAQGAEATRELDALFAVTD